MRTLTAKVLLAALAGAVWVTPTAAGAAAGNPAFAFGRTGGNIMPWAVAVAATGTVTTSGPVDAAVAPRAVPATALRRVALLVASQRFNALPQQLRCPGANPDIASRYITVTTAGRSRTVAEQGDCNTRFETLYAALSQAAGVR